MAAMLISIETPRMRMTQLSETRSVLSSEEPFDIGKADQSIIVVAAEADSETAADSE